MSFVEKSAASIASRVGRSKTEACKRKKRDPIFFNFGEAWPSSESDDSDYSEGPLQIGKITKRPKTTCVPLNASVELSAVAAGERIATRQNVELKWTLLPNEILERVFHVIVRREGCLPFLLSVGLVCRHWRDVSTLPSLWINLNVTRVRHNADTSKLMRFLIAQANVATKKLMLTSIQPEVSSFEQLIGKTPNLIELNIAHCTSLAVKKLFDCSDGSGDLIGSLRQLKFLDISSVSIVLKPNRSNQKSAVCCRQIFSNDVVRQLEAINVSGNFFHDLRLLPNLLSEAQATNLKTLDISNIYRSTGPEHSALFAVDLRKVLSAMPRLENLIAVDTPYDWWFSSLKGNEVDNLAVYKTLRSINFTFVRRECHSTTDHAGLVRLISNCENLQSLRFDQHRGLTFTEFAQFCRFPLSVLSVGRCVGVGRVCSADSLPQSFAPFVEHLDISWISGETIVQLVCDAFEAAGGSSLRLLHLSLVGTSVTKHQLEMLLKRCDRLTFLDTTSCRCLERRYKRCYTSTDEISKLRMSL